MLPGNPFQQEQLKSPGVLGRLRKTAPAENALIEINNMLARDILTTTIADIEDVSVRYQFDVRDRFKSELAGYYRACLEHCMSDDGIPSACRDQLHHLKSILGISDNTVAGIQTTLVLQRFEGIVAEVFMSCPGSVSAGQLQQRGRSIGLTEEETNEICKRHATLALQQRLETFVDDQRWSPDEEQQLAILAEQYEITPTFDASTQEMLDRFRLYWNIEEGVLPEVPVDIHLQRGETAHFAATVDWYEFRTQTRRINYGGPTARIRIAKGVYYRVGSANVQRVTEEVMQHIDSGALYVTNKRIIFVGGKKNTNVRLNKILDFNVYQNGIEIVKDAGRNPFLAMDQNVDICGLVIDRVLRNQ